MSAIVAVLITQSVHAQLSTTVGVDSDYRYRGVSLSKSNPSARLTVNFEGNDRWYAGGSATRAALTDHDTYPQLTAYGGWFAGTIDRTTVELGVVGSHFVGSSGYDFFEG